MDNLRSLVVTYTDVLRARGYALPDELKLRDKREPHRKEKLAMEDRLTVATKRHFKRQAERIRNYAEMYNPDRKVVIPRDWVDDAIDWEDEEWERDLIILLTQAAKNGIIIFQEQVLLGMDYTLTNAEAAKWAKRYVGELIKGVDDTTKQVVRSAVREFVETPGFTIGDLMRQLPFSEQRAMTIAITETTRAYAEGQMLAGQALKEEYPDVRIVKTWFVNNDDLVCPICAPLNGVSAGLEESFPGGIQQPPAHVNCRCWISTGTKLVD